jgi:hypothetical protein
MPRQARLDAPGTLHYVIIRESENAHHLVTEFGLTLAEFGGIRRNPAESAAIGRCVHLSAIEDFKKSKGVTH